MSYLYKCTHCGYDNKYEEAVDTEFPINCINCSEGFLWRTQQLKIDDSIMNKEKQGIKMTKSQLIRTLEPFDDDIHISLQINDRPITLEPSIFYKFSKDMDEAEIVLTIDRNVEKGVELKIK